MDSERWRRIEAIFHAVRERERGERVAFMAAACGGDDELRREVQSLLDRDDSRPGALDIPAAGMLNDPTRTTLTPGQTLGPFQIEARLGAGGMGEVFRALDTRLGRRVAIKTCSAAFGSRFASEGRAIAALNHPNVCTLYDVGPNYLVMELVEGQTLAALLRNGPLPIDLAIRYGTQIAEALAAAHANGIVHRDLKPSNVMIAKSGVKVLDFGLAKSADESETVTQGIVGTPAYMAPEQREGRRCDARTDIYALGLVLHEMATCKRPSAGAAPELPHRFAHVVERCLPEEPDARWQSARDVAAELTWAAQQEPPHPGAPSRRRLYVVAAVAAVALASAVAYTLFLRAAPGRSPVVRLAIALPEEGVTASAPGTVGPPAISPDGKAVAFPLGAGPKRYIWLRNLESAQFAQVRGSEGGNYPFWSPDSKQIAFFADGKLKKAAIGGADPQTLCAVAAGSERGGTWNASGTIIYGVNYAGLFRIPDRGGEPVRIAALDDALGENSLRHPAFLSDGRHFVAFSRTRNLDDRGLYLYTLDVPGRKKLAVTDQEISVGHDPGSGQEFVLYSKSGKLWAHAVDRSRWELRGDPATVDEDVGLFSASNNGTLVFRRTEIEQGQFTWFDRAGLEQQTVGTPVDSWDVSLSPDDRHIAFQNHRTLDGHFSIWLIDAVRNVSLPFSVQTERSFTPVWSPDGSRVYFHSVRPGPKAYVKPLDAAGIEQPFARAEGLLAFQDLSRDGRILLALKGKYRQSTSLVYASLGQDDWRPLLVSQASQMHGQFSPDGRQVAYESRESGAWEIYVVDFPGATRRQRISVAGGREPRWGRGGKELIYYDPKGALMSVDLSGGAPAAPARLFSILFSSDIDGFHYAVSHDGQRILAIKELGRQRSRDLNVVINWPRLLRLRE